LREPTSHAQRAWWLETASYAPIAWWSETMRLGHARGLACAKTKKFPCIFLASPPPTPPPRSGKEMERKFLVLLRRFSLRKEQSYFNIFVCSFLRPHGDRGALVSTFGGSSKLCAFDGESANSSMWSLAIQNSLRNGEAQIFVCVCPTLPVRAQIPAVFRKNYKMAGMAP